MPSHYTRALTDEEANACSQAIAQAKQSGMRACVPFPGGDATAYPSGGRIRWSVNAPTCVADGDVPLEKTGDSRR